MSLVFKMAGIIALAVLWLLIFEDAAIAHTPLI